MSDLACHYSRPQKRGPKSNQASSNAVEGCLRSTSQDPLLIVYNDQIQTDTDSSPSRSSPTVLIAQPASPKELVSVFGDANIANDPDRLRLNDTNNLLTELLNDIRGTAVLLGHHEPLSLLADRCIDAYISFLFPIAPIVHGKTLHDLSALLDQDSYAWQDDLYRSHMRSDLERMRSFALLTAICAEVGYMLPSHMCPLETELVAAFFRASKRALLFCRDDDVTQLNSSSIVIRYLHCNCTHATGHIQQSWIIMGETIRLALLMRLHDENTYLKLSGVEHQLCRNIFWQLYTADKSSSMLNVTSFMLHNLLFYDQITVQPPEPQKSSLLSINSATDEAILMIGFNACQSLFQYGSELYIEMKLASKYHCSGINVHQEAMTNLYFQFNTALDALPQELQCPRSSNDILSPSMLQIQAANLMVTKHCLRLLILQRCVQTGLHHVLGLPTDGSLLNLRRLEIATDFTHTIQTVSFEALRVNGEPSNEKIRQVGAALLEIQYESRNDLLSVRAARTLKILLDILSRLDSRASQTLLMSREIGQDRCLPRTQAA